MIALAAKNAASTTKSRVEREPSDRLMTSRHYPRPFMTRSRCAVSRLSGRPESTVPPGAELPGRRASRSLSAFRDRTGAPPCRPRRGGFQDIHFEPLSLTRDAQPVADLDGPRSLDPLAVDLDVPALDGVLRDAAVL